MNIDRIQSSLPPHLQLQGRARLDMGLAIQQYMVARTFAAQQLPGHAPGDLHRLAVDIARLAIDQRMLDVHEHLSIHLDRVASVIGELVDVVAQRDETAPLDAGE